jgi:hypothetical protein
MPRLPSAPCATGSAWSVEPGLAPPDRYELRHGFGAAAVGADSHSWREWGLRAGLAPRAHDRLRRGPGRCRHFSSETSSTAGLAALVSVRKAIWGVELGERLGLVTVEAGPHQLATTRQRMTFRFALRTSYI